jgi:hypothetical protein
MKGANGDIYKGFFTIILIFYILGSFIEDLREG